MITADQFEDPAPFFKVTWMVWYRKAGRLVLAVPCKFSVMQLDGIANPLSLPGWKGRIIPSCYILICML